MFQPKSNQVRRAPRKLLIEIEGFWKKGMLASLVYMPTEELKLINPACGKRLLGRSFQISLKFGKMYEKETVFALPYKILASGFNSSGRRSLREVSVAPHCLPTIWQGKNL